MDDARQAVPSLPVVLRFTVILPSHIFNRTILLMLFLNIFAKKLHIVAYHIQRTMLMMLGISLVMMPAQTTGLNQLPRRLYAHGTAIMNTLQQVAGAVGVALFISIMSSGMKKYLATSPDPMNPAEGIPAMVAGLHSAFVVGGILSVLALLIGFFIRRTKAPQKEEQKQFA